MRVKKFFTIVAGIALGAAMLGAGAVTLLWLFSDNNVSINVFNRSGVVLRNVAVIVPGSPFSGRPEDMSPDNSFVFATETKTKLPIHVVFDADGRHYDVPTQLRLAPFGSYLVSISIDDHMQVSFKTRFL